MKRPITKTKHKNFSALLSGVVEAWAHQILYTRNVYPPDTFGCTRFMGIQCHVSRHPDVVSYIRDFVSISVSAFMQGDVDLFSFLVVSEEVEIGEEAEDTDQLVAVAKERILEEYVLKLTKNGLADGKKPVINDDPPGSLVERSLRGIILRVLGLKVVTDERRKLTVTEKDSLSFRMEVRMSSPNVSSADIKKALAEATWIDLDEEKGATVVRPLYSATMDGNNSLHFMQRRPVTSSRPRVRKPGNAFDS